MNELLMPALAVVGDVFTHYDPMPFGLHQDDFIDYATGQFQKRWARLEAARAASQEEVEEIAQEDVEEENG
jgi:hypothetical protein